jgi:hypothetical protein
VHGARYAHPAEVVFEQEVLAGSARGQKGSDCEVYIENEKNEKGHLGWLEHIHIVNGVTANVGHHFQEEIVAL